MTLTEKSINRSFNALGLPSVTSLFCIMYLKPACTSSFFPFAFSLFPLFLRPVLVQDFQTLRRQGGVERVHPFLQPAMHEQHGNGDGQAGFGVDQSLGNSARQNL